MGVSCGIKPVRRTSTSRHTKFIERERLLDEAQDYLENDTLIIKCTVKMVDQHAQAAVSKDYRTGVGYSLGKLLDSAEMRFGYIVDRGQLKMFRLDKVFPGHVTNRRVI